MAERDAVVVGSGINSLACAALLARAGWSVAVLEREDELGGAIRTAELTEPGYLHDVFSAWHPLWVGGAAHAELGDELAARGLEYLNTEHPTATLFPDGEACFLLRSTEANVHELGAEWEGVVESFFPNADLAFGVLGTELWSTDGLRLALRAQRRLGRKGLVEFAGNVLSSSRDWLTETFASERTHGLLAPWVLHTGLGPDSAASGFMTQVIGVAVQEGGMPIPRGGGARLVDALVRLIEDSGGTCETGRDVERVLVRGGRAAGVRLADGGEVAAARAVIANVTPTQLYGRLLDGVVEGFTAERGRRFRYGRSEMQIHFALSEPPRWEGDVRLGQTAIVHLTPGLDGVSRAVNEAERGLLPAEATVVVGQPLTMDVSRAPDGAGLLWIQLQELPWHVKGDAAGELDTGDGTWTEELRERYADRIQARVAAHVPNLESSLLRRVTLSPSDLQAANVNLHHGDPYSGSLVLDQNLLWRPFPASPGHATPVKGLWQIGASTHPGPGLGAGSGTMVARQLLEPGPIGRLRERFGR
ncbi:MAG TPA: NAD(P)/FAD-dependent oxidoreductase [Gaiellaceae bacterium]|nr:NAD(P)/FAD-dependent oxidoreductase [Gaiellaceae bacterium]